MMRGVLAACVAGVVAMTTPAMAEVTHTILGFDDLQGWADDDHQAALSVFLNTCGDMNDPDWKGICAVAARQTNAKTFFELFFRPVLIEDGTEMLFTGYYEPELNGSRTRAMAVRGSHAATSKNKRCWTVAALRLPGSTIRPTFFSCMCRDRGG